jgi:hypothetical protein
MLFEAVERGRKSAENLSVDGMEPFGGQADLNAAKSIFLGRVILSED